MKVLSSDTRVEILKELGKKRLTPSDLSRRLDKHKSTIVEHLQVLQEVGLVEREESPGKKWVFYSLTDEGRGIISPAPEKRAMAVSRLMSLVFSFVFAILTFFVVTIGGLIVTEYVFHIAILTGLAYYALVGGAFFVIIGLLWKGVPRRSIWFPLIVGILVLPYAQFVFGFFDVFVKDDAMVEGMRAEEVRFDLTVELHDENTSEWVVALDSVQMTLYPGENFVHLGSLNIPGGKYDKSRATNEIEVDIVFDLGVARGLTEDKIDDKQMMAQLESDLRESGLELKNYRRNGVILYYTMALTTVEEQEEEIDYPGRGGPDLYISIILDESGRPTKIEKEEKAPPGLGQRAGGRARDDARGGPVVGPGGCTTPEECNAYCSQPENYEECTQWCKENPAFCGK